MNAGVEISDRRWEAFDEAVREQLRRRFGYARKGSPVHRLGVVTSLLGMLDCETLGAKANKTLREYDREARNVLAMRRVLLERQRTELLADSTVREVFKESERSARFAKFGYDDRQYENFARFLVSDAFEAQLAGKSAAEAAKRREVQIGRLAGVAPKLAEEVACHWAARQIETNPIDVLRRLPEADRRRGAEALLEFLSKVPVGSDTRKPAPKSATVMGPATGLHALLATPKARKKLADTLVLMLHSPALRNSIAHLDDQAMIARLKVHNVTGVKFLEAFTRSPDVGRGVTTLFSMWAIFVVARNAAPLDGNGRVRWEQMRVNVHGLISITTTLPDVAKFCEAPLGPWMAKVLSDEFGTGKVAGAACKVTTLAAHSAKFKVFCESLGVIGDFFTLPFAIRAIQDECGTEDLVGMTAKVAGCISTVGGFALGLCAVASVAVPPLLIVGTACLGIASALVDSRFGESALTGKIRKDLRYLGIADDEDAAHEEFATQMRTVTRGYGAMYYGGTYTARERVELSHSRIRSNVANAEFGKKLALINHYFDGKTSAKQETLVLGIFNDARRDPATFIRLVEAADGTVIADELEKKDEACRMLCWTARAYESLGLPPGPGLTDQLIEHCRQHRWKTVVDFLNEVTRSNPLLGRSYGKIPTSVLMACGNNLMDGWTRGGEEWALNWLHVAASDKQIDALVADDDAVEYFSRLEGEMKTADWKKLFARMQGRRVNARTRRFAEIIR